MAIVVSCTIRLHVGFLAIALAWLVGVYVAGMSANEVMAGFPTRLFLTLAGVTLLFSQGSGQRHARPDRPPSGAVLSRQRRRDADDVLSPHVSAGVDRTRQHRRDGARGANGDGGRRPGGRAGLSDGNYGWQRGQRRVALPDRADRRHRQRRHGRYWSRRLRMVDLPQQHDGPYPDRLRRVLSVRRMAATRPVSHHRDRRAFREAAQIPRPRVGRWSSRRPTGSRSASSVR